MTATAPGSSMSRILTRIYVPLLVAAAAYLAFCWWSYSGVYRWLAEQQMTIFGSFDPTLTGFGPLVLLLLPASRLGRRARSGVKPAATVKAPTDPERSHRIAMCTILALGAACLLGAGVIGTLGRQHTDTTPTIVELDPAHLPGTLPAADRYVASGILRGDLGVEWSETNHGNTTRSLFVPMVAPDWRRGEPIPLLLQITPYGPSRALFDERRHVMVRLDQPAPYTTRPAYLQAGFFASALPGPVADLWTSHGQPLAPNPIALDEFSDPAEAYEALAIVLAIFGVSLILVAALTSMMRHKRRGRLV